MSRMEEGEVSTTSIKVSTLEMFITYQRDNPQVFDENVIFKIFYNMPYREIIEMCEESRIVNTYCTEKLDDTFWRGLWISDTHDLKDVVISVKVIDPVVKYSRKLLDIIDDIASIAYEKSDLPSSQFFNYLSPAEKGALDGEGKLNDEFQKTIFESSRVGIFMRY